MDILVRKYVEKKANKWGFSDDIDISKEIIKVENTYSDKIFKVRFNSFRFLGYYGLDAFVGKQKIIFSPEWAARVVLKRNESQIPFLYTLGHEMAHTERDICPLKHPKYCKFIAWTNEVHADLESGKIFLNRDKKKLLSAMLYICNSNGKDIETITHPSWKRRLQYVENFSSFNKKLVLQIAKDTNTLNNDIVQMVLENHEI